MAPARETALKSRTTDVQAAKSQAASDFSPRTRTRPGSSVKRSEAKCPCAWSGSWPGY